MKIICVSLFSMLFLVSCSNTNSDSSQQAAVHQDTIPEEASDSPEERRSAMDLIKEDSAFQWSQKFHETNDSTYLWKILKERKKQYNGDLNHYMLPVAIGCLTEMLQGAKYAELYYRGARDLINRKIKDPVTAEREDSGMTEAEYEELLKDPEMKALYEKNIAFSTVTNEFYLILVNVLLDEATINSVKNKLGEIKKEMPEIGLVWPDEFFQSRQDIVEFFAVGYHSE